VADTVTVERVARIAGMLGSEHEGERATAAQIASNMLKAMGLTWSEVIRRGLCAASSRQQAPSSDQGYSGSWGSSGQA